MCNTPPPCADASAALPSDCRTEALGVAFFDLSRIGQWSSSEADTTVAGFFQEFYRLCAEHIVPAHDPQVLERYPAVSPALAGAAVRLDVAPAARAPD